MKNFIIKGDIAYSKNKNELFSAKDAYVVCAGGICQGVFLKQTEIPSDYAEYPLIDHSGKLVIPGMIDLHIHAPQFAFRGMHMDEELMDWLNSYTFVEEAKYVDLEYADKAYDIFAKAMQSSATTRAVIFGTVHREATEILMDKMECTGLVSYVGKVNQDRFSPEPLDEGSAEKSIKETRKWLDDIMAKYTNTKPIITPRFIPTCTDELMAGLGSIVRKHDLPVQSHLSENPGEIATVQSLSPDIDFYAQGYDRYGMLNHKTVMAHCIYTSDDEARLIIDRNAYLAHCPSSNLNLRSGIAPIRKFLNMGMNIGLGSDVAGGESESIFEEIVNSIKVSKALARMRGLDYGALTFNEAFWMATASGGEFFRSADDFGACGKFEKGYEFDAIVIDEALQPHPQEIGVPERVERSVYLAMDRYAIVDKFVRGRRISGK